MALIRFKAGRVHFRNSGMERVKSYSKQRLLKLLLHYFAVILQSVYEWDLILNKRFRLHCLFRKCIYLHMRVVFLNERGKWVHLYVQTSTERNSISEGIGLGFGAFPSCLLSCSIWWVLSGMVVITTGKRELVALLFFGFMACVLFITKTRPIKYIENFATKDENFQMKNSGSFHISAQNIDWG